METVVVFGAQGFLGSYLVKSTSNYFEVYATNRARNMSSFEVGNKKSDLNQFKFYSNEKSVLNVLSKIEPSIIFNVAAIANIEECALNPKLAYKTNAYLPEWLSKYTSSNYSKLVHFSTDSVFGQPGSLFTESEKPEPISTYGKSKLEGELKVLENDKNALIIRTNFFGWSQRKLSLFNYFYNGIKYNNQVNGYINSFFTPIYIEELIRVTLLLIKKNSSGLFHVTGNSRVTKYEFGQKIASALKVDKNIIKPSLLRNYSSETFRNYDISLNNSKVTQHIGIISEYNIGIENLVNQIEGKNF
jgi:dTDP-4-dehydrorhamnose reductase